MIMVQDIIVSEELVTEKFICDLNACKGACCIEGDVGAPLEEEELAILSKIFKEIKPFLSSEGIHAIRQQGYFTEDESGEYNTPLLPDEACAYRVINELGIMSCGIEQAYLAGATKFKKPISCHLYPIRITKDEKSNFEALNYDRWDICSAACTLGAKEKVPVYQFLKEPIIRKYGTDFYEELDAAAQYMQGKEKE